MATDYSKLKNAELEALLKERGLPSGGKKADMVARLSEADKSSSSSSTAAPAATTEPAAAAIAAGGTATRAPNPVAVPNQAQAVDPSKTADLSAAKDTTTSSSAPLDAPAAGTATEAGEAKEAATPAFTSNLQLAPTDIDAEIAKRKARAAKFGISEGEGDAIKALERAKRFGTGTAAEKAAAEGADASAPLGMSRLDQALPERGARKRGRGGAGGAAGGEGGDSYEDEGLKRRRGGGGGGGRGRPDRPRGENREGGRGGPSWMTDADRAAAEKRKAKFATAS